MTTTIFGKPVDVVAECDAIYGTIISSLLSNELFVKALDDGKLTDAAKDAILAEMNSALNRRTKMMGILLADKDSFQKFSEFWFARAFSEVKAHQAYMSAFKKAFCNV